MAQSFNIGSNAKLNYNCIIACHDQIDIGESTEFGPPVYLYDHDHDYRAGLKENKFKSAPISIGKNCWIGANTVILRGTEIGDNCVVGAGSVIKGKFPSGSVIIQKKVTEIYGGVHGLSNIILPFHLDAVRLDRRCAA